MTIIDFPYARQSRRRQWDRVPDWDDVASRIPKGWYLATTTIFSLGVWLGLIALAVHTL